MNTRDIKGRIKSVTNIKQITEAMKLVASARLRRAEEKAKGARPYAEKIEELIRRSAQASPDFDSPLFRKSETVRKTGYIIISSDKGLAGAYNSNVMKMTMSQIAGKSRDSYTVSVCGKQARNYLRFRGYAIDQYRFGFSDKPSALDAREVAKEITASFLAEEVDEVYIIYTKFYTALRQEVTMGKLLPIEAPEAEASGESVQDYIFLPDAAEVFSKLLPEYIEVQIYSAMLQSAASELGSRMAAMSAATDNAAERIDSLNLSYNKARQAQVTGEINEIVGGANALE